MNKLLKGNKKLIKNTLFDLLVLSIIAIICMIFIHFGLKVLLHINTKTITDASKAMISTKHNILYINIMVIAMFIFSFIIFTITTMDQIKDKTINKNNYKLYLTFMIGLILLVNTFLSFIGSNVISIRLTRLCNVCETIDMSFYTYQLDQFINTIKLLCCSYVLWSIISIGVVVYIINKYKNDNTLINKIKKLFKK